MSNKPKDFDPHHIIDDMLYPCQIFSSHDNMFVWCLEASDDNDAIKFDSIETGAAVDTLRRLNSGGFMFDNLYGAGILIADFDNLRSASLLADYFNYKYPGYQIFGNEDIIENTLMLYDGPDNITPTHSGMAEKLAVCILQVRSISKNHLFDVEFSNRLDYGFLTLIAKVTAAQGENLGRRKYIEKVFKSCPEYNLRYLMLLSERYFNEHPNCTEAFVSDLRLLNTYTYHGFYITRYPTDMYPTPSVEVEKIDN